MITDLTKGPTGLWWSQRNHSLNWAKDEFYSLLEEAMHKFTGEVLCGVPALPSENSVVCSRSWWTRDILQVDALPYPRVGTWLLLRNWHRVQSSLSHPFFLILTSQFYWEFHNRLVVTAVLPVNYRSWHYCWNGHLNSSTERSFIPYWKNKNS